MLGELKEYTDGKRESQFRRKNGKNQSKILAEVGSVGILGSEKLSPINKNSKELNSLLLLMMESQNSACYSIVMMCITYSRTVLYRLFVENFP
jgi:hypothetical protein